MSCSPGKVTGSVEVSSCVYHLCPFCFLIWLLLTTSQSFYHEDPLGVCLWGTRQYLPAHPLFSHGSGRSVLKKGFVNLTVNQQKYLVSKIDVTGGITLFRSVKGSGCCTERQTHIWKAHLRIQVSELLGEQNSSRVLWAVHTPAPPT